MFASKQSFLQSIKTKLAEDAVDSKEDLMGLSDTDIERICGNKPGLVNLFRNGIKTLVGEVSCPIASAGKKRKLVLQE